MLLYGIEQEETEITEFEILRFLCFLLFKKPNSLWKD